MKKKKKSLIGQKYTDLFGKNQKHPHEYRRQIKSYKKALLRLAADLYKSMSAKTKDEKFVQKVLIDIREIEFYAATWLNSDGRIIKAPQT